MAWVYDMGSPMSEPSCLIVDGLLDGYLMLLVPMEYLESTLVS